MELDRHSAVLVATLICLLPSGCHSSAPTNSESMTTPEAFKEPTDAPQHAYIAWVSHTEGRVGQDLYPAPLPGGKALVFSSNRHSNDYKLYLRASSERTTRRLTHGAGDDLHAAVSPDGHRVVFASNRDAGWHLYLLEGLEDPVVSRLGSDPADAMHPDWSPDGTAIAYSRRSPVSGEWEVWVLELETSQARFICEGLFPTYHPEGDRIAFQRHRKRDDEWYAIWTVETDGTHEREIVSGKDWAAVNPSWSPDGSQIVFNTVGKNTESPRTTDEDIYVIHADGTGLTRVTSAIGAEWNPNWGADGRIYFNATVDGDTAVWSLTR